MLPRRVRQFGPIGSTWKTTAIALVVFAIAGCATGGDEEGEHAGDDTGEMSDGEVTLALTAPQPGEVLEGPSVTVEFDLQGYEVYKNEETGMGQHIHVILDNQPYIPHYSTEPFTFENVEPGTHTIRAFPSREWHESIKDPGAFAMVTFHVGEEDGENTPVEGEPLLTYSRPKGDYAGEAAERILVDYWVKNCTLGQQDYRVRMRIDGNAQEFIQWEPYYLEGLSEGEHTITLTLVDPTGQPVPGVFNETERVISVSP